MTHANLIEKIGRAIADHLHKDGDYGMRGEDAYEHEPAYFNAQGQATLTAIQEAGLVVVPREPLEEARKVAMKNCVAARIPECGDFGIIAQTLDAMIAQAEKDALAELNQEAQRLGLE